MNIELYKSMMKAKGMTYDDLSTQTGISKSAISKIFGGFAKNPRVDTIITIEEVLGINKPKRYKSRARRTPYGLKPIRLTKLETLILQLTIEEKAELTKYAEYLISKREK